MAVRAPRPVRRALACARWRSPRSPHGLGRAAAGAGRDSGAAVGRLTPPQPGGRGQTGQAFSSHHVTLGIGQSARAGPAAAHAAGRDRSRSRPARAPRDGRGRLRSGESRVTLRGRVSRASAPRTFADLATRRAPALRGGGARGPRDRARRARPAGGAAGRGRGLRREGRGGERAASDSRRSSRSRRRSRRSRSRCASSARSSSRA